MLRHSRTRMTESKFDTGRALVWHLRQELTWDMIATIMIVA